MFQDKQAAQAVHELALKIGKELDNSIVSIQQALSDEELKNYKLAVGKVMGDLFFEIMQPIYELHPEMVPDELNLNKD